MNFAVRRYDTYDIIFSDIDDTIIYGFWTNLMSVTWNLFKSPLISGILMMLQEKFNLYKVNKRLVYILSNTKAKVVFLTARKEHTSTVKMLRKILPDTEFDVSALGTNTPSYCKLVEARNYMHEFCIENDDIMLPKCCIFDDNEEVRYILNDYGIDAFEPTCMITGFVG